MDLAEVNIRKITDYFRAGYKEKGNRKVGIEIEHFVIREDKKNATYGEIAKLLKEAFYHADVFYEKNAFMGCETSEYMLSLEPAAQLEISIKPRKEIKELEIIYQGFCDTLKPYLEKYHMSLETYGYQPYAEAAELPLIPKKRYEYMDAYFKRKDTQGIRMMRGSAATQITIDYTSELDFIRKFQFAQIMTPVFALLTENMPVFKDREEKLHIQRTNIWNHVDARRCGIVPKSMESEFDFYRYAEYVYHVPLIFVEEGGSSILIGEWSAAEYYQERVMNETAIEHMLSMVFPDVRLKNYIEIRTADSLSKREAFAYARLVQEIFYGENFSKLQKYFGAHSEMDIIQAKKEAMYHGEQSVLYGRKVKEIYDYLEKLYEEPMQILLQKRRQ